MPAALLLLLMSTSAAAEPVEVEAMIRAMTLEQKVGQLLMVGFGGTAVDPDIEKLVRGHHVGGVALFARNVVNASQTAKLCRELQALMDGDTPLFISLDQEGGNVVRIKDRTMNLPGNMVLGASRDQALAYLAGQTTGIDLAILGFNMNLAPVLDVNSNPRNPVIGIRSYGETPELVARMGRWYTRGQQEAGVATVAKHFPGHGDTHEDSHFDLPSLSHDRARLRAVELKPFADAIAEGLDAIMTAHVALPNVAEEPELPATLSHVMLTDILRGELGFEGVVITDGLEMKGVVDRFGMGPAAVRAIQAGADMAMVLWTPAAKEEVYQALLAAARAGTLSETRIEQSVRRILRLKAKRGILQARPPSLDDVGRVLGHELHAKVSEAIARAGVTLVRNEGDVVPVKAKRIMVFTPVAALATELKRLLPGANVSSVVTPFVPTTVRMHRDVQAAVEAGANADLLVVAMYSRYHLKQAEEIIARLPGRKVVAVSLGTPYFLSYLTNVEGYLCAYSYHDAAAAAAAEVLAGKLEPRGRLPVSIPGLYPYGHHLELPVRVASPAPQLSQHLP